MIERFFVRDVTILHPALVATRYSGTDEDFSAATPVAVKGWLHQLTQSELQSATRDAAVSAYVLRLPRGTVIDEHDRVVIDGDTYSVDGAPHRAWTPRGEHHTRVELTLIEG